MTFNSEEEKRMVLSAIREVYNRYRDFYSNNLFTFHREAALQVIRMYDVLSDEEGLPVSEEDLYAALRFAAPVLITIPEDGGEPDPELLTDVIGYNRELIYSHQFDTIIARLKVLAPAPEK